MSLTRQTEPNGREKSAGATGGSAGLDRRSARTRNALHLALLQLIHSRDYDEISVADIAEAANVGRSTFYAHYTDKDDLLRRGMDHLRVVLLAAQAAAAAAEDTAVPPILGFSRFMTEHLKERYPLYRALMRGRAGPIILERIRDLLSDLVRAELAARDPPLGAPAPEMTVRFVVGAYLSVVTWWLDRGAHETPEAIDQAFRELALGGVDRLFSPPGPEGAATLRPAASPPAL